MSDRAMLVGMPCGRTMRSGTMADYLLRAGLALPFPPCFLPYATEGQGLRVRYLADGTCHAFCLTLMKTVQDHSVRDTFKLMCAGLSLSTELRDLMSLQKHVEE